ncbi:hypothetical protein N7472_000845 [Penicillium cf. griseofulvum]|uniref:Uncharacterized protein n=1 Tax=Penicillium cf. griseofulvum TaxID=2972120 RepID=A0A9W9N037_9EURO|nr:hypothetical protein N7472_000845 [Penicillium cf. griseofulvum]KAJ5428259.1 hypothetical protein N7445_009713 [Penicillium cf. griseofulvum]
MEFLTKTQKVESTGEEVPCPPAAEEAAREPLPTTEEVDRLWDNASKALEEATSASARLSAAAAGSGSGVAAISAGGDLGDPGRGSSKTSFD